MENTSLLSGLSMFTLVVVLVILVAGYMYFLRSRRNREATSRVLGIDDTDSSAGRKP